MSGAARYIMIGGFLGAGKTTAVDRFARALTDRGHTVGLITNDQSTGLVDTAILRSRGFAVEEIAGGCFCCRFDSLQTAADRLSARTRPDIFLAEPVGSCTDLLATVSYPLRRIYGDDFRIAPLSVLVDPRRAARVVGLAGGRSFSEKVIYVYRKQLEEADLIVVNKIDDLDEGLRGDLVARLGDEFPHAEVLCVSAKDGDGTEAWLERLLADESDERTTMELDYRIYGEGEAQLGWLNATIDVTSKELFNGNELLLRLAEGVRRRVAEAGGEVAHLKMTLDSGAEDGQLSVVSLVSNDGEADLRESLLDTVPGGTLILNLRAELSPETLSDVVGAALEDEGGAPFGITLEREHEERFRPAQPEPTHRIQIGEDGRESGADVA